MKCASVLRSGLSGKNEKRRKTSVKTAATLTETKTVQIKVHVHKNFVLLTFLSTEIYCRGLE